MFLWLRKHKSFSEEGRKYSKCHSETKVLLKKFSQDVANSVEYCRLVHVQYDHKSTRDTPCRHEINHQDHTMMSINPHVAKVSYYSLRFVSSSLSMNMARRSQVNTRPLVLDQKFNRHTREWYLSLRMYSIKKLSCQQRSRSMSYLRDNQHVLWLSPSRDYRLHVSVA